MTQTGVKPSNVLRLTESAVCLAFSVVLSLIVLVKMPFGGTVTAFSMLPIIIIAYRHGVIWGMFTGMAFGITQMLLGLSDYSYVTGWKAYIAVTVLDFLLAYAALGLAGIFRKRIKSQSSALVSGVLAACTARFFFHVISGCTVWNGVSIPSTDGLIYSIAYNSSYMLPETVITAVGAVLISGLLCLCGATITRATSIEMQSVPQLICSAIGRIAITVAAVVDVLFILLSINTDDGYDPSQLVNANWIIPIVVTLAAAVVAAITIFAGRRKV